MEALLEGQSMRLRVIERALDNFKKLGRKNLTAAKIRNRIQTLKEDWEEAKAGHRALLAAVPVAERPGYEYFQSLRFEATQKMYQTASDHMAECLEELEPYVPLNQSFSFGQQSPGFSSAYSISHLPPMKLPPFDGKYEEWESFRDRFTSLILNNKDLSNFTRMHYLISCLKNRALDCVKDIRVTADNFDIAWNTLNTRFENKRRLINVHMTALLNLPAVAKESAIELQSLSDRIHTAVAALNKLNRTPEELWSDMLVSLGTQKLDAVTKKAWNLKFSEDWNPPSYEAFNKFLENRIRAFEEWKLSPSPSDKAKIANLHKISSANICAKAVSQCSLCKAKHAFSACPQFAGKSPSQRREIVQRERRCFNCLSQHHAVKACSSKFLCRLCQKPHHTMLHVDSDSPPKTEEITPANDQPKAVDATTSEVNSLFASSKTPSRSYVLLATAWVTVSSPLGRSVIVRALLDQGSKMSFITEELAQCLRLKRVRMPTSVSAVGGVHAGTYQHAAQVNISPRNKQTPAFSTHALILKLLRAYAPKRMTKEHTLAHLADLPWADHDPMSADPISIIVGADLYSVLIVDGLRKGAVGQPIAQNSVLGWVISGPIPPSKVESHITSVASSPEQPPLRVSAHHCLNLSLDQELRKFWEVEEIPHKTHLNPEDEQCEEHFRRTHSRCPDGRYMVRLPFRAGPLIEIGHSRDVAEHHLKGLARRLDAHPEQKREYSEFLREYETLEHMIEVPASDEADEQRVYIPHHAVMHESSATSHLSVVFNASCATSNGSSLNDHLLVGPKLQPDLPAIILRWRLFKYVYTADMTKMYRQIRVDPRDVTYQRILWRERPTDPLREYILLTVTYDTAAAPYLALRVLDQLVNDEGQAFPLAVFILQKEKYIDETLFGAHRLEDLRISRDQLIALLRKGGFELRKWASNNSELSSDIDPANHELACNKILKTDESLKILGVSWNPALDIFQFQTATDDPAPQTKRSILSAIAKLFDPLGWVTPVTITAKILMQRLWRFKFEWDDTLPHDILREWKPIYNQLSALNELHLPRWTGQESDSDRCELHGLADASNVAYAAAVYLRVISKSGRITISLLMGKSKVAPVKTLSVPRLELLVMTLVRESVKIDSSACYCWIDAEVVLAWLRQHPSRWKTFVANRVAEIQSRLPDGPPWLKFPATRWPEGLPSPLTETSIEEKIVTTHAARVPTPWDLASQYLDWAKLIRVTAYLIRFVSCRGHSKKFPALEHHRRALLASECHRARTFWLGAIQADLFPHELHELTQNQPVNSKSHILALNPFIDSEGLIRVGGRLRNAPLSYHAKHPIVLASHPGLPESMHSDNGTTFVGADKELAKAYRAAVNDPNSLNAIASDNVQWHFLPPSAPHFGGLWEAGVRSVKYHLRRVLKNHTLTFEELTTLLCRIEACLNSRPLAPLSDTLDDYEVLTPGHFLIGSALTVNTKPSLLNVKENRLSRWQSVRHIIERFWRLWQTEYVSTLQQRVKWRRLKAPVKIGQLVLLRNAILPPCKWELGRVTQCHADADGLIRVVTVRTPTSEYKRPIVKLCLLPIDCEAHAD
ncbi:uncharacterized protein [Temnothorax longispinosus]|uniref:uncharacterized protein n=1 Tax=Temnothorax longispinosus TaxID=300112 RepID=UPI003A98D942